MRPTAAQRSRILAALRSDRGFAMPTVLLALVATFGLATAAVVAATTAQTGSVRDQNTKAALGAAEAGISNAMLRFNRTAAEDGVDSCTVVGAGTAGTDGWCSEPVVMDDFDRGGYTYWVRPTETELAIVSMGTVDGVTRRVKLTAPSDSGQTQGETPFGEAGIVGLDGIHLDSNGKIYGDVATNGDITLDSNAHIECGYAGVGPGRSVQTSSNGSISCEPTEAEVSLPPVNPGDVMANNSNDRICGLDPCVRGSWDPDTRELSFRAGGSITLGAAGGVYNYALCKLSLSSNSYLQVASGAAVRLYFGSPDPDGDCDGVTEPLTLSSNSKIQPTGSDPADLAILIVGSSEIQTHVDISSNAILFDCEQSFVLYGPRTDIRLSSNVKICGGVAGKSIDISSYAQITSSQVSSDFELPNTEEHASPGYGPPTFVECSAAPPTAGSPPDTGC